MVPGFKLDSLCSLLSERELRGWEATRLIVSHVMKAQRHRASADARLQPSTLIRLREPASLGH